MIWVAYLLATMHRLLSYSACAIWIKACVGEVEDNSMSSLWWLTRRMTQTLVILCNLWRSRGQPQRWKFLWPEFPPTEIRWKVTKMVHGCVPPNTAGTTSCAMRAFSDWPADGNTNISRWGQWNIQEIC